MSRTHWLFAVAVALQVIIVVAVPASRAYTLLTGETVFLKTSPVDPYDIMSGYHVILSYAISRRNDLPNKPDLKRGERVYVVLKEGDDGFWHAETASSQWPKTLPSGAVVIKGKSTGWRIDYGIERYFIPEGMGREIEEGLRANRETTRIEVKVDSFGNAALVRLHIGDKTYDY